jgi:hypothetical protein
MVNLPILLIIEENFNMIRTLTPLLKRDSLQIMKSSLKPSLLKITTIALLAAMSLSACQSTPTNLPVLQRANNTLETTGLGKSKNSAKLNALHIATEQCRGKSPIVLTDSYQYNGVLDENMGRAADQAIGMIGSVFGSKKTLARDDDYEYTMTFRCP